MKGELRGSERLSAIFQGKLLVPDFFALISSKNSSRALSNLDNRSPDSAVATASQNI